MDTTIKAGFKAGMLGLALLGAACSSDPGGGNSGGGNNTPDIPVDNANSPVGTNLVQPADFSGEFPFVDHMKMARPWFSGTADQFQDGRTLSKDSDGWPDGLLTGQVARSVIFTSADIAARLAGSRFIVLKSGNGDVEYGGVTVESTSATRDVVVLTPNLMELRITRTSAANPLKLRLVPEGGVCAADLLTRVSDADDCPGADFVAFEDANAPSFMPEFLDSIKVYRYLRFMDWGHTNRTVQNEIDNDADLISFAERARPSHATFTVPLRGVPIEVMVELCNLMNMDIWINIPYRANNGYIDGIAATLRDGLEEGRTVFVEYSNEVWNGIFVQTLFAESEGQRLGLDQTPDGPNAFIGTLRYYAQQATRVMKRFETVFGGTTRLRRVVATLQGNGFAVDTILGFEDTADNVDFFAIAPYFGDTAGEGSFPLEGRNRGGTALSANQEIARFKSLGVNGIIRWLLQDDQPDLFGSLEDIRFNTQNSRDAAAAFGKPLISYEGGQHFVGIGNALNDDELNELFDDVNRDPRMKQVYQTYLENWREDTDQRFTHFYNVDAWSPFGRWGAREFAEQDRDDAPKFNGILTYIEENPLEEP